MEIVQIIISILSLIATIFVSFAIYWLQMRHEKEIQKMEKKKIQEILQSQAEIFRIDNAEEIDYLPLCVIATSVNRYANQHRNIYTRFNKCTKELQNEILKQENMPINVTQNDKWVDKCIKLFIEDFEKYELGKNMLYEGAKYLHRAIELYSYYKIDYDNNLQVPLISNSDEEIKCFLKMDLSQYIDQYLRYSLGDKTTCFEQHQAYPCYPPMTYLYSDKNLGDCDEYILCYWIMEFIIGACNAFYRLDIITYNDDWRKTDIGDAYVETYEDMYYYTLLQLYEAYYVE